jgi:hypothetical protein
MAPLSLADESTSGSRRNNEDDNFTTSPDRSSVLTIGMCGDSPVEKPQKQITSIHTSQCKTKKRSVNFSDVVEIYPVLHRRDMSPDEVQNMWINRYERRQSRTEIRNTLYLMQTGVGYVLSDDDYVCSRGLEHLYEHPTEYDEEARKSQKIALAMQRVLRRARTTNPNMIARAYFKYTLRSRKVAYEKAIRDRKAVVSSPSLYA